MTTDSLTNMIVNTSMNKYNKDRISMNINNNNINDMDRNRNRNMDRNRNRNRNNLLYPQSQIL